MVFETIISFICGYIGFTQSYPWVKLTVLPNFTQLVFTCDSYRVSVRLSVCQMCGS